MVTTLLFCFTYLENYLVLTSIWHLLSLLRFYISGVTTGLRKCRVRILTGAQTHSDKLMGNNPPWEQAHAKMSVPHL